jgi:hypothetical protein
MVLLHRSPIPVGMRGVFYLLNEDYLPSRRLEEGEGGVNTPLSYFPADPWIFHLKGPKHEIFGFGFFTSIKPVWIGDLGTRPKKRCRLQR